MICFFDLPGRRLILRCGPCQREGCYDLKRLCRRFGDLASVEVVAINLT